MTKTTGYVFQVIFVLIIAGICATVFYPVKQTFRKNRELKPYLMQAAFLRQRPPFGKSISFKEEN